MYPTKNIAEELKELNSVLADADRINVFSVPDGYFENFPSQVLPAILPELALPEILSAGKQLPFEAPAGYFDQLSSQVLNRIRAMEAANAEEEIGHLSPLLGGLSRKLPFSVPENYFQELSENVVSGASAIEHVNLELENLSPIMHDLKTVNVYRVPEGYFESTATEILGRLDQKAPAKVVSMSFGKKALRYASAAIITGIIATSAFFFFNADKNNGDSNATASISKVSDQEILNFLEESSTADQAVLPNDVIQGDDFKEMFADIPESELQQYLNQYGDEKEMIN